MEEPTAKRNLLPCVQDAGPVKKKNKGRPGKESQKRHRKAQIKRKRQLKAIERKDAKLSETQAELTKTQAELAASHAVAADLSCALLQNQEDLDGMAAEREEAFTDRADIACALDAAQLELGAQKLAAHAAEAFLAEVAPGLAGYQLLSFSNEYAAHAAEVEAGQLYDQRVARQADGYQALAPGTACLLNNAFVLANLCNDGYLSGDDLASLLDMLQQVSAIMPPQNRSSIAESGTSYGMGATRKFYRNGGRAFESYLLKLGRYRDEHGDTVETADPELYALITLFAQKLEKILASIFPLAALNRLSFATTAGVPVFLQTGTTCMYDTCDYVTAAHRDSLDDGRCKTVAVFLEQHESSCQRKRCARRWRFFCPELKRYIAVRHGTIVVWNSKVLLHGTTVHSTPTKGACKSTRWAIVSQVKSNHVNIH